MAYFLSYVSMNFAITSMYCLSGGAPDTERD